jgi:hypothetical protein
MYHKIFFNFHQFYVCEIVSNLTITNLRMNLIPFQMFMAHLLLFLCELPVHIFYPFYILLVSLINL